MNYSHNQALKAFARRLERLLVMRSAVQMATVWFFVWGTAVLVCKISGLHATQWLPLGIFGVAPIILLAMARAHRRQPAFTTVRANYDRLQMCGGVMMAGEMADMGEWQARLPAASVPVLHWHCARALGMLGLSLLFMATTLWLPERFARLTPRQPLEIGAIVEQLQTEVQILQQEKIVADKKADDVQKQLSQLKQDSSSVDPDKTWEALDHIKESNAEAAQQAADEAVAKTTALTQAETMDQAMEQAAEAGMSESAAGLAAQNLSALVKAANLEDGILQGQIPPALLANLNGLSKRDLENLMKALEASKSSLSATVGRLSDYRLVDPTLLSQCRNAGLGRNPSALAEYLSSCTNGCSLAECLSLCNGGPGGGGPAAPMTWMEGTSEKDVKFKEHLLPQDSQLSDAVLVGISRGAPQLNSDSADTVKGALDKAMGSGGSARTQIILPEHRQAVQNFFNRDQGN
jgi:hypothetical protein